MKCEVTNNRKSPSVLYLIVPDRDNVPRGSVHARVKVFPVGLIIRAREKVFPMDSIIHGQERCPRGFNYPRPGQVYPVVIIRAWVNMSAVPNHVPRGSAHVQGKRVFPME